METKALMFQQRRTVVVVTLSLVLLNASAADKLVQADTQPTTIPNTVQMTWIAGIPVWLPTNNSGAARPEIGFVDTPLPRQPLIMTDIDGLVVPVTMRYPAAEYRADVRNPQTPLRANLTKPAGKRKRGVGLQVPQIEGPLAPPTKVGAASTPGITFDSADFVTNVIENSGQVFIPADPIAAAGLAHVVNVVNTVISIHQKDGTLAFRSSLADFFDPLDPVNATFDPKVIYDQFEDRWLVVTLEQTDMGEGDSSDSSRILLAVSDDANPLGTWFLAGIDSKETFFNANVGATVPHWADYPGLAVDEEAVYITNNMFAFAANGNQSGGVRLWVIEKAVGDGGFYDGGSAEVTFLNPYAADGVAVTTMPAHVFGPPNTGALNVGTYLLSYSGLTGGGTEFVQVVRLDDPLTAPTFTQSFISLGDLEDSPATTLPDAAQLGTAVTIEVNDRRMLHAVWRDDALYGAMTVLPGAGSPDAGQPSAHWVQLSTGISGAASFVDQGTIGGEDIAADTTTFFPSIAVNDAGVMVVGFSASAATIFPSAYYAYRDPNFAPGTISGSMLLRDGVAAYQRTFGGALNRWGDYSGVAVDPTNQCFWIYNKYAITQGTPINNQNGRWGTAYQQWCAAGAINDCNNNGIPDEIDFPGIEACIAGPDVVVDGCCTAFDLDLDNDSDLADFQSFQQAYVDTLP